MVIILERRTEISLGKMQETSLSCKPDENSIEAQNERVYQFIKSNPNSSMKDTQKGLGTIPINTICWRFKDLRAEGRIFNSKTGREMMWSVR